MSDLTANTLYGRDPAHTPPTPTGTPDHAGAPEPSVATHAAPGSRDHAKHAVLAIVVVLAAAIVLSQVAFRGTIEVRA